MAILPDRGRGTTSEPMLEEIQIAIGSNLPYLIIADPNVQLTDQLDKLSIRLEFRSIKSLGETTLQTGIGKLHEEWRKPFQPHYVFFATDFCPDNKKRNRLIKEHIQRITCMECIIGDDIKEVPMQQTIISKISHAFMMIADISEENINTIIEAGIAIGSGLKENLHLIARGSRRDPYFMFADKQILCYADELELIGLIHRIAYRYRRRVLNYEYTY